jgi:uncharacterized protein (DUF302 family)
MFRPISFLPMLSLLLGLVLTSTVSAADGVISAVSPHSVNDSADKLESIIKSKGLTLFNRIDHQANAAGVDLTLNPTVLLIFGNPKVGTPVMVCSQSAAIDLPQKILITEDDTGTVQLSYNDPMYVKARHNLEGCDAVLEKISTVLAGLTAATVAP